MLAFGVKGVRNHLRGQLVAVSVCTAHRHRQNLRHSRVPWVLILVMYIGKRPPILFKIAHNIAAQGNRPNEQL